LEFLDNEILSKARIEPTHQSSKSDDEKALDGPPTSSKSRSKSRDKRWISPPEEPAEAQKSPRRSDSKKQKIFGEIEN